jgi:hypothetical protein
VNDEVHINLGKQDRVQLLRPEPLFCGLKFNTSAHDNLQLGLHEPVSAAWPLATGSATCMPSGFFISRTSICAGKKVPAIKT